MNGLQAGRLAVLVTGATGFTGGRLVARLIREGHQVTALVRPRPSPQAQSNGTRGSSLGHPAVTLVPCDLGDPDQVQAAFRTAPRPDVVFHVAAAFRQQHADQQEFGRINANATGYLCEAASVAGVGRFVHCSTVGVQGEIDDPPATEEYRVKPGDIYQQTKLEGERIALAAVNRGLPVSVVRPVGIYGPGDRRFLKLFRAIAHRKMIVIGNGETLYHLTYVDDVVEAMMLAARVDRAVGEVFTIAGERYTTLNELFALIARTADVAPPRLRIPYAPMYAAAWTCDRVCRSLGIDPPLYPRRVEFFAKDRAFTIEKARRVLGFEPRVDLEEGLARTYAWYIENDLL